MTPTPDIYVVGGSNSILAGGWLHQFRALCEPDRPVVSRAVGASSSLMGAFRTIMSGGVPPGSTLIWEYALNDALFIDHEDHAPDTLLRWVEYTLRYCARHDVAFIALILTPRHREQAARPFEDTLELTALFERYGVLALDAAQGYREASGQASLPHSLFLGNNHYAPDGPLPTYIAETLCGMLDRARAPADVPACYVTSLDDLVHIKPDSGGRHELFQNRLVELSSWDPAPQEITLCAPDAPHRILGAVCLQAVAGGRLRLRVGGAEALIPLERTIGQAPGKLLQIFDLHHRKPPIICAGGETLHITWDDETGPGEGRFCGLLLERMHAETAEIEDAA